MNPTVILTLLLLSLMAGAGVLSASVGYSLGRDALTSIRQPDSRPGNGLTPNDPAPRRDTVVILKEDEILANVQARIEGRPIPAVTADAVTTGPQTKAAVEAVDNTTPPSDGDSFISYGTSEVQFPISSEDDGIVFQVLDVRQDESAVVLDVSLHNQGSDTYRFLYSFMTITDDQGRTFNGSTTGLPSELPASDKTFYGTISIPRALLDGAQRLSLALTDYPDQQIAIQMSGIPVQ